MVVRTRFAPSPTGFLHVGGVRTALFSWLFARHHQGEFILRIEDTDQERSTQESVQAILEGMAWLGLEHDKGPYYQTERYPRYLQIIEQLLDEGKAYRCYCTKERLETLREAQLNAKEKPRYDGFCRDLQRGKTDEPHVIRFKNPQSGMVSFSDQVYGDIHVGNSELDDLVLLRSDGHPTYNFAVVIDDWDMGITHVIRGDDHINNTPRQINLFNALGAPVPTFAHLPMILGEDGKRLSKRHGAVSVLQFKELGILPHALLNYLVRLGWSYGDKEIFSLNEMIELFNLNNVSRGASSFNYEKLYWLNQHYQKFDAPESVAKALEWHFSRNHIDITKGPALEDLVSIQAERCKSLAEICEKSRYFYEDSIEYDADAVKKHLRPVILEPLSALYERFAHINEWERDALQQCINDVSAEFNLNMGKIAQPLRVAVTGSSMSPSIDMTLKLLGKHRVLSRLQHALQLIEARASASEN
ncbi:MULTISPECIES: glutamate--tRNA ligase [Legionella]|uniref:Glutamate--tRNA ligase n=1 Tax=Legionella septentrionalis TaxID=2498109 RepID=A0A3S0XH12_9GAMM|nr:MULTISPECIES: glutamate--tRNA ligase [Legionella]MCP0914171.1 glutamate--tRNA ligase [Legionella sp. 27cVA30]RUQ89250.1 glutamate--tRNA ligase [Legionella septentrionalis]RUQ94617.1 glutamate--tRNA ligase [Legionella septentrionalis]RUR11716.1 glutamate--tRNA ligase [Legionella septentrionalis]RUR17404.1 glutamate--tRNA ligase [Legionella septentrionalis]